MAVRVNIITTYNGAGQKKALRDLALLQKQATLAGRGVTAGMLSASAGMQRAGAGMAKSGAFMSRNISLPIAAIGVASVVMAAKFESAMKLIQTQAGGSAKDVEELSTAVLELATKGQHGPEELSAALYHLKSVGMENVTAMKALTAAEQLASVGHADLEETTNAVAGAYKSGIKGAQDFGVMVGTLNAIIGAGNLRMEDLNAALGTGFLVTAQTFGVSLTSVGSALAMMTSRGIPATRAAMAIKMAMAGMAAPSAKAEKIMSKLHLSSKKLAETMRSGGMLPALTMLKEKLAGLSKTEQSIALTKMFGAKSSMAILTLLGNLRDYDRTQKQVAANTGKFAELAAAQAKDLDAKWAHFKSSMGAAVILIGNQLLPTAIRLADDLSAVSLWLTKLSPSTRKWVVGLGLIVAVGGPVLLIVGKMTLGIGKMVGGIAKLTLAFGKGAAAAPKWARGIAGATKGTVNGIKNLTAGFRSTQAAESAFTGRMGTLGGKLRKAFASLTSGAAPKKLAESFKKTGSAIADSIAAGFNASKGKLKTLIQAGAQKAASGVKLAITTVTSVAASAAGTIKDTAATVANTAAKLANAVATKAVAAAQWLWNAALTANPIGLIIVAIVALVAVFVILWKKNETFRRIVTAVWEKVKSVISALLPVLMAVGKAILGALSAVWNKVSAAVKWFWGWAGPFIKKAVGFWWASIQYNAKLIFAVVKWLWTSVSAAVKKFWNWAGPFIKASVWAWWTIIKTTFHLIKTVTVAVWNAIKAVVQANIRAIVAVIHTIQAVVGFMRRVWNAISSAISGAISRAVSAVSSGVSSIIRFFAGFGGKIKSAIGNLGSLLYNAGSSLISGFLGGIKAGLGAVWKTVSGIAGRIRRLKGPPSYDAVLLAPAGTSIMQGLINGIEAQRSSLKSTLRGVTKDIALGASGASLPGFGAPGGFPAAGGSAGGSAGRSTVIHVAPGAVVVKIEGASVSSPSAITSAVRAGVEPALQRLAIELSHL